MTEDFEEEDVCSQSSMELTTVLRYDGFQLVRKLKFPKGTIKRYNVQLDEDYMQNKITVCAYSMNLILTYAMKRSSRSKLPSSPTKLPPAKQNKPMSADEKMKTIQEKVITEFLSFYLQKCNKNSSQIQDSIC